MKPEILILTPVYNDWQNLHKLLDQINRIFAENIKDNFNLVVVDDNSTEKIDINNFKFSKIKKIKLIKLSKNVGSQRAIALGLKYIKNFYIKNYKTIIIDSDGQDNPLGIIKMLKKNNKDPDRSIVAKRDQRKEPLWFKIFYEIYNFGLTFFTLKKIRYGNFSFLNDNDVNKILLDDGLWNAFPPTVSKNLKNINHIILDREKRFSGDSKMNFFGLIYHALRIFSVLRFRVFFLSLFYTAASYIVFFSQSTLFFYLVLFLLILLNLNNFILAFSCKEKFEKEFKNIEIFEY